MLGLNSLSNRSISRRSLEPSYEGVAVLITFRGTRPVLRVDCVGPRYNWTHHRGHLRSEWSCHCRCAYHRDERCDSNLPQHHFGLGRSLSSSLAADRLLHVVSGTPWI